MQSVQSNPDTVFKDALTSTVSTSQLEATTSGGQYDSQVAYDFTDVKNPLVSSQTSITRYGASFELAGYGSVKNSYISYTSFPGYSSGFIG